MFQHFTRDMLDIFDLETGSSAVIPQCPDFSFSGYLILILWDSRFSIPKLLP